MRTDENHEIVKTIREEFKRQPQSLNIVVASEYLLHMTSSSKGKHIQWFANWTNVRMPEIVKHSRSKRMSQVLSVWKHFTSKPELPTYNWSFHQYICSKETENLIGRLTDPLSASQDLVHSYGLRTTKCLCTLQLFWRSSLSSMECEGILEGQEGEVM